MWYEKKRVFCAVSPDSFFSGVGVLDPTTYNYEDEYANGVLQVCDFYCSGGIEYSGRICHCKVYYNNAGKPYFRHNGRRYWLNDFERCII